jgi:hypothetical protein
LDAETNKDLPIRMSILPEPTQGSGSEHQIPDVGLCPVLHQRLLRCPASEPPSPRSAVAVHGADRRLPWIDTHGADRRLLSKLKRRRGIGSEAQRGIGRQRREPGRRPGGRWGKNWWRAGGGAGCQWEKRCFSNRRPRNDLKFA